MPLSTGDRLGRYEVLAPLGAGGMGEVYRARDTELDRDVAMKVLPDGVAQDPARLERFEREAKAVARLSHPNIVDIYDYGHETGVAYAVTELLEGETLRERLGSAPVGWRTAATIGAEIADGLVAAHGRGVVHRDLKPANIFLTSDGRVKILDFGLARLAEPARSEEETEALESTLTSDGAVIGTVGYMSPEQVRGQPADHRSDIFSLGCVLYEMVGGRRAFDAASSADTMAAILTEEPLELSALGTEVPPHLERAIHRCLEKAPDSRFQSAADLAFVLRTALAESGVRQPDLTAPPKDRRARHNLLAAVAGALVAGALVSGLVLLLRHEPAAPRPLFRFTIPLPEAETLPRGLALSPDGTRLVWAGSRLYQRRLDRLEELEPIPDTEFAKHPFFSPDGQWLGFHSADGKLTIMPVEGGLRTVLADTHPRSRAIWSVDDSIVFTNPERGISRISAHGGEPMALTAADPGDTAFHQSPQLLPGERVLIYVVYGGDPRVLARWLDTGEETELTHGRTARYLSSGHLIFVTRPGVVARPFDPDRLQFSGPPRPVLEGIWPRDQIAVSETGSLAYIPVPTGQLMWVDRDGAARAVVEERRWYTEPRLSPDQRHIAVGVADEIWLYDLQREAFSSVDAPGWNMAPVWAPDGQWLTFNSDRAGWLSIESHAVDGSGREKLLIDGYPAEGGIPESWSPDGRYLIFRRTAPETGSDIWVLPADGETPRAFLATPADEFASMFSPDGKWIAYSSDRSGTAEIYATDFPDRARTIQISTDGGTQALWAPDGGTIYYRNGVRVMAVPISYEPSLDAGKPEVLFTGDFANPDRGLPQYGITSDGERFLMIQSDPASIVVVTDWFEELKRLAPTE